jgi:hypothetical protein
LRQVRGKGFRLNYQAKGADCRIRLQRLIGYPALLEFSAVSIFKTCSATSSSSKVAIANINSFGACLKRSSSRKVFNADFLLKLSKARILES